MSVFVLSGFDGRFSWQLHRGALMLSVVLCAILCAIIAASLMSGSYPLTISEVAQTLFASAPSDTAETVVWQFRFPRILVAAIVGALFGLSGAILQNITRNPLADPSLVGVSQGASLAVVAAIVVFPEINQAWRPVLAFAGALAVAVLLQSIAMQRTGGATMRFILTGIGVAAFIAAITNAMLTYGNIDQAQAVLGWLAGSIHAVGWAEVWSLSLCVCILIPLLIWAARYMSALRMGAEVATGLGLPVRFARMGLITLSVALAAFAVSAVGLLGFVGLVAPHLAPASGAFGCWPASDPNGLNGCDLGRLGRLHRAHRLCPRSNSRRYSDHHSWRAGVSVPDRQTKPHPPALAPVASPVLLKTGDEDEPYSCGGYNYCARIASYR